MTQHALRGMQVYRLPAAVLALLPTDAHLRTSTAEKLNSDNSHAVHLSVHTVSVITHMGTTLRYACVSLETFQPNPIRQIRIQRERKHFCPEKKKTFCYNLKKQLRIREEYMWLYGHAMLEIQ